MHLISVALDTSDLLKMIWHAGTGLTTLTSTIIPSTPAMNALMEKEARHCPLGVIIRTLFVGSWSICLRDTKGFSQRDHLIL